MLCLLFSKSFVKNMSESSVANLVCESGDASAVKCSKYTLTSLAVCCDGCYIQLLSADCGNGPIQTFKCRDMKPLKRVGNFARCRNQGQLQSGAATAQPKKYKRRTLHTGLFCLFAGAFLQGIKTNQMFGGCSFVPWNLLFPTNPLFR